MHTYLRGTELLGALGRIDEENLAITRKIDRRLVVGTLVGAVAGAVGLAFAWKTHRIVGGILGLLFVGPAVGGGGGLLLSLGDFKKIRENQVKKRSLEQRSLSNQSKSAQPVLELSDFSVPF